MSVNAVRGSPGEDDDRNVVLTVDAGPVMLADGRTRQLVCLSDRASNHPDELGFCFLTAEQADALALELGAAAERVRAQVSRG